MWDWVNLETPAMITFGVLSVCVVGMGSSVGMGSFIMGHLVEVYFFIKFEIAKI